MIDEDALIIYTDGSSHSKPRRGGVGFKIIFPSKCNKKDRNFCPQGYEGATNNQMELQACILAIKEARRFLKEKRYFNKVIICTDSKYVVDGYASVRYWNRDGWRLKGGAPVVNKSLWKELLSNSVNIRMPVEFRKVKGHVDKGNKEADALAERSSKRKLLKALIPSRPRRKISPKNIQVGSVKMNNQNLLIRVITSLEIVDGEHRYVYEVMDKDSEYYGYVDKIWSKKTLSLTHIYIIKVNDNQEYPQIKEVIKEIEKIAVPKIN